MKVNIIPGLIQHGATAEKYASIGIKEYAKRKELHQSTCIYSIKKTRTQRKNLFSKIS